MLFTDTELTMITFHPSMDSLRNFEFGYSISVVCGQVDNSYN